jgi:outer membrane protein assembly factor BamD (BamD/ComL family)
MKLIASVGILALLVAMVACNRKPNTPDPKRYAQQGDAHFEAGDYARAIEAYEAYLKSKPSTKNQDKILFQLALAYSMPDSGAHDPGQAREKLQRLIALFPKSPYRPQAKAMLKLNSEVERLRSEIAWREDRMRSLQEDIEALKSEADQKQKQNEALEGELERQKRASAGRIASLQGELERLRREVERLKYSLGDRESQIKSLRKELDQLKRIDIERRPQRPHG